MNQFLTTPKLAPSEKQKKTEEKMTLKTFIDYHFGTFEHMNKKLGWKRQTSNRYYNKTPHRFIDFTDEIIKHTDVDRVEWANMVALRMSELQQYGI